MFRLHETPSRDSQICTHLYCVQEFVTNLVTDFRT